MHTPRCVSHLLVAILLAAMAGRALAEEDAIKPVWSPPRLSVEGKSTGEAALTTQVGITVGLDDLDLSPSLTYEIQSASGVGSLLSVKEEADGRAEANPRPWALGATVNVRGWGAGSVPPRAREALDEAKRSAFAVCALSCRGPKDQADVKKFCELMEARLPKASAIDPSAYGADQFCQAGEVLILAAQKAHPALLSHARPFNANLGFQVGGARFKHLGPDAANPGQLVETTTLQTPWTVGGNVAWLQEARGASWTVEALLTHGVAYDAAEDTARYCVPAGDVTSGGGTVPATICKELGATGPTRAERTRFGAYVGWFDAPGYVWRAALGVEHTINSGKHRTSVSFPIYRLIGGTSDYKGMIRVAPGISFAKDPSEATVYSVTISLLGQREFFSEKFDRL